MILQDFKKIYKKLPDHPGVYFFLGPKKEILYIGKATSLRDRLKSYFGNDLLTTRGALVVAMVNDSISIDFQVTDSVLEALILEQNLIKKHQPRGNTKDKDDKSFNHVIITKEKFPRILFMRGKNIGKEILEKDIKYDFGPYPNGAQLKEALRIVRKIFPYRDHRCVTAEDQIHKGHPPRPCFNRQIGLCPGVCTGEISARDYAKTINHIRLFFEGKKTQLVKQLEKEMAAHAKAHEFELASISKRKLFAINHIQDVSLIKEAMEDREYFDELVDDKLKKVFRIEAYDVAHLSGENMVGAMVVLESGEPNKAEYRKFKIQTVDHANDIAALREILNRRFTHKEWPRPDVLVVDGNETQLQTAKHVVEGIFGEGVIDVIAVVKNERHKPSHVIGKPDIIQRYNRSILLANNEAHRFVLAYHKRLRSKFIK